MAGIGKKYNRDLILSGNMLKVILTLAIPVILNSFLQTMYNLTDAFWLGKLGMDQLAAINLVSPVQSIVINFGAGITVAGAVLLAQYMGAKREEEARSMANQIFAAAQIFAVFCALICFLATPAIVRWLGAEGDIYQYSVTYLRISILDMPFLFMINIYQAIHQAQGDTVRPVLLNLLGISLNMILAPLMMITLGLGVAGAAGAVLIAKSVPAVIAFILLCRREQTIYLDLRNIRFERDKMKDILRIGLPTAIGGSTMQFGFLLMSRNVLAYGGGAMAAYGIGNRVNGLISLPSNAIGSAVATIVGQNMGARKVDRAQSGYLLSRTISMAFLFVGGMILSRKFISTAIVSIFSDDPAVIAMAADFLSVMAFWSWTNGMYNSTIGLFQGTGHTEVNMAVDATRLWVFRFLTLWFCETVLDMGVRSIWYSVVISNGISAAILFLLYKSNLWKKNRIKVRKEEEVSA